MRLTFTMLCLLFYSAVSAQKYSNIITDTAIINVMKSMVSLDTFGMLENHVSLMPENIGINDSLESFYRRQWLNNLEEYQLTGFLGKADAGYFARQIIQSKAGAKWDLPFVTLFERPELKTARPETEPVSKSELLSNYELNKHRYYYSLPLFSVNKNYAVIHVSYSFSAVKGGSYYYLLERQPGNWWKVIQFFGGWGE